MNAVRNYQKELDKILDEMAKKGSAVEAYAGAPTLFLHSCCAPCSSYVLEYLRRYFRITVFYFNPNITEDVEYRKRVAEQKRLIAAYNMKLTEQVNHGGGGNELTDGGTAQDSTNTDCDGNRLTGAEEAQASVKLASGGEKLADADTVNDADGERACAETAHQIEVIEGDYEPARFYEIAKGLESCPEGGERCFACYALRLRETAKRAQAGQYDYFTTTLSISPLKNAAKLNEIGEKLAGEYGVAWLPSDFKKRDGYKRSIELSKEYDLYRQDYCGCVYSQAERRKKEQRQTGAQFGE